jgi:glycosyltransferase involved in cell wall biosynthesis
MYRQITISDNIPTFSIIMVSYNQERMIEQSIQSVLTQNYSNLEFIIIDGQSSDESPEIIKKYSNKIQKIVFEKDRGMYHARNKGILMATGDYLGFLNTDDLFYPDALNDIAKLIVKENFPDMVFGYTIGLTKSGTESKNIIFGPDLNISKEDYFKKMNTIPDQSTFYKREAIAVVGLYDTSLRFGADTDLKCRFIINEMRICTLPKIIAGWRMYEEALTFRPDLKKVRFKEAIMVNNRYTGNYLTSYTLRLFIYNYIVPTIKGVFKYFKK